MERTGGFVTGGEPAPLFYRIQPLILRQLCLLLLQFVEVVIGLRVGSRYIIAYSHSWECFVILYYFLNELHEFNWGMLHNGCDFVSIWCSTFAKTWKIHLLNPSVKEIKRSDFTFGINQNGFCVVSVAHDSSSSSKWPTPPLMTRRFFANRSSQKPPHPSSIFFLNL